MDDQASERGVPPVRDARAQIDRIIASSDFQVSERNRLFLRYVTDEMLAGRAIEWRERRLLHE